MAAEIRPEDLRKHPHLARLLQDKETSKLPADNTQSAYSADDAIIPIELWERPEAPLPVVIVHQGSDRVWKMALSLSFAVLLTPVAIIVAVLAGMAPGVIMGAIVGALVMYGITNSKDKERGE